MLISEFFSKLPGTRRFFTFFCSDNANFTLKCIRFWGFSKIVIFHVFRVFTDLWNHPKRTLNDVRPRLFVKILHFLSTFYSKMAQISGFLEICCFTAVFVFFCPKIIVLLCNSCCLNDFLATKSVCRRFYAIFDHFGGYPDALV